MAAFLNACRFNPTLGGTTDWTYSSPVPGYQNPAAAGMVNGRLYKYRAESTDLSQWEIGEGAYNTGSGVLTRTTVLFNSAGTTAKISFSTVPQVAVVALKEDLLAGDETGLACGMTNGKLVPSAAAGALTVAVKTVAGNDPSATDPVYFYFRNNTLATGDVTRIAVTAALSVVLGSTKTLGATSGNGTRVWIAAFNNAGTVQLAAMNCSDSSGVFCPQENVKYTTAVPANSSKAWYSTSAIGTAAPWRFLGFCEWNSLATAGTWVAPDTVQLFGPGVKKPGDIVQTVSGFTTTPTTTTSTTPVVTTSTANITPSCAANLVKFSAAASFQIQSTIGCQAFAQMYRGASPLNSKVQSYNSGGTVANIISGCSLLGVDLPSSTSSLTYAVYIWASPAPNVSITYALTGSIATIVLEEIMG
jgi:hypothetical protein